MEAKWRVRGLGMQIMMGIFGVSILLIGLSVYLLSLSKVPVASMFWGSMAATMWITSSIPYSQWQASFKSLNNPTFGRCLPDEPHIPYSAKGE